MRANVGLGESNTWAGCADDRSDGSLDIVSADLLPRVASFVALNRHLDGGDVSSKVCHSATHDFYWTPLGMAGSSVSYQLSLDSVILHR